MQKKNPYESVVAVGIDVHYKFSRVSMRDAGARVIRRERLEHADRAALVEQLNQWPRGISVVMEGSFGWGWMADLMKALDLEVCLANCYKMEKIRKARGLPKTNKKDADLLSLMPFEKTPWWRVWLPPWEVREQREWMRYRAWLVDQQTQTKNRIHAVFHRHGIFHGFSDLFGGKGRKFLGQLCKTGVHESVRLPEGARAALQGHVRLLGHQRRLLSEVERRLRKELAHTPLARRLDGIPGFGLILAHTLMAEIGEAVDV